MLAKDLRWTELVRKDEKGFLNFGSKRIMIVFVDGMLKILEDMQRIMGPSYDNFMTRFGYNIGMASALFLEDLYHFDTPEEWLKAGSTIRSFSGLANETIKEIQKDGEKIYFSGVWQDSLETLQKNKYPDLNLSNKQFTILTSLSSGFASTVFGKEIWVKEVNSNLQGADQCQFEGRSIEGWGATKDEFRNHFDTIPFEEELQNLRSNLKLLQKDLEKKNREIHRLKSLGSTLDEDDGIVYRSKPMAELLMLVKRVAPTPSTVLIQGESGTGKEVIARFIHRHSDRFNRPFVAVSCAALPPNLLESELFGHVKGAFTGAEKNHAGLLIDAGKGTFFLDEVGELPLELQAKLLRALQEKEIRPVGGLKSVPIQARIIAATNNDLSKQVKSRKFREDLYYRLAVFPLNIVPLRERRSDILVLAHHFLKKLDQSHPGFRPEAIQYLEQYDWPGNVRELENCVEYSLILAGNDAIQVEHLPSSLNQKRNIGFQSLLAEWPTLSELERKYTQKVLEYTGGNKSKAARIMGTSTTTVWRRLKEG